MATPEEQSVQQSKPKIQCYGADLIIQEGEEKKVSKHAKRRANKKAKQAAAGGDDGQPGDQAYSNQNGAAAQDH